MSKKNIIIFVTKHIGEVDNCLPIINKIKKNYNIVIIFNNKHIYNSLREDKILFNLCKKFSKNIFYIPKFNNFFFKFLVFLLKKLIVFNNTSIFKKLLRQSNNFDQIFKKKNLKKQNTKALFISFSSQHGLAYDIREYDKKIPIFRFQEFTHFSINPFNLKKNCYLKRTFPGYENLPYDYYLFSNNDDAYQYLGKVVDKIRKKIIYTGYPKFENKWIKNLIVKRNKKNSIFKILVSTRGYGVEFNQNSFEYIIRSILNSIIDLNLKNIKIYFKPHPHLVEYKLLKKIIDNYNLNIEITMMSSLQLLENTDLHIDMKTSLIFESAILKKKRVQFFLKKDMTEKVHQFPFDAKKKEFLSPAEYHKVAENISNHKEIKDFIYINYKKFKKKSISTEKYSTSIKRKLAKKKFEQKLNQILNENKKS